MILSLLLSLLRVGDNVQYCSDDGSCQTEAEEQSPRNHRLPSSAGPTGFFGVTVQVTTRESE